MLVGRTHVWFLLQALCIGYKKDLVTMLHVHHIVQADMCHLNGIDTGLRLPSIHGRVAATCLKGCCISPMYRLLRV